MGRKKKPSIIDSETARSAENPTDPIENLPLRQRAFVRAYTDTTSPAFGNGSQSYQAAYGAEPATAIANASKLLRNTDVSLAIKSEIERQGLGAEVRVGMIKSILQNRYIAKSKTTTRKADDGSMVSETESTPRAQDALKALALLDRWDGSEAARQAESAAKASMLQGLTKRLLHTLDTKARPPQDDAEKVPLRASSGNPEHGTDTHDADTGEST